MKQDLYFVFILSQNYGKRSNSEKAFFKHKSQVEAPLFFLVLQSTYTT